jgi:ribosomal protein L34E
LEDLTSGRPQTAKVGQKGKKKVERTLQERQHEWKERMLKEMEEYLLRYNEQQKSLFEGIQGNADKETTMIAINRKKREQVYGAQLGLEMLKERFAEQ